MKLSYHFIVQSAAEPGLCEGKGEDPGDDDLIPIVHQLTEKAELILLPEGIEAPDTEFLADPLHPGRLVDRFDGSCDDSLDLVEVDRSKDSGPEVPELVLLLTLCLLLDDGQADGLGLKGGDPDVRGMEHVALYIPGQQGDEAHHLPSFHCLPQGMDGILASGE